ncbi:MAG TPA: GNAT family N-acetyltransferase [Pyrinomonadaceae bacterium]|jgi:GNAT superfamily N-acetyltransferase
MEQVWRRGEFEISTERARLDFAVLHDFLSRQSYWARGRSLDLIKRSVDNSLPFGLYKSGRQIGFARVVTDRATFAWLADVFVLAEFRGQGLAKWMVEVILAHPELQNLRRWVLATRDAHELYRRFGFEALAQPDRWLERFDPRQGPSGLDSSEPAAAGAGVEGAGAAEEGRV